MIDLALSSPQLRGFSLYKSCINGIQIEEVVAKNYMSSLNLINFFGSIFRYAVADPSLYNNCDIFSYSFSNQLMIVRDGHDLTIIRK